MKEQREDILEQQALEGEILPPLKPDPEKLSGNREAAEPVVQLNLTQINEIAKSDPDIALTYIVNLQPVVEVGAKQPIEELFEKATEGLLTGADTAVRGVARLANYRSLNRASAEKSAAQMKTPDAGKAAQRP
jgi:hypothetical protein